MDPPLRARLFEVIAAFLPLGLTSFGGPVAHLGYFRAELVAKRRWIDDDAFADLVALCQFLPGPASSQVVFALGYMRAGLLGALVASLCFTLPSALLMIGFALGVAHVADLAHAGWLHGLQLAAVAVVAQAVWVMGQKLCPDRLRVGLCIGAAATLLIVPGALTQIGVLVVGAAVGWWRYRTSTPGAAAVGSLEQSGRAHLWAAAALVVFAALLVLLPVLASTTKSQPVAVFDAFYRSGALVFGGGHVVLPLLRAEVVPPGWLGDDAFLAGYGAAQAVPGPLFSFAAYLGAAISPGPLAWRNGLWCLFAIFLPAWLLIGGALPFWQRLRRQPHAQAALAGTNAAVVGVLFAALCDPVIAEGVRGRVDVAVAVIAFGLLEVAKVPPWVIVVAMAAAGQWIL
ncbi:MAG: chromate efflux transporter [Deltaproteobacteria bacterium]|nr:chromate efflux transporter [Deltaproteobacteria bacterium]